MLENMIRDAEGIRDNLSRAVRDLELAMEQDAAARRVLTEAKQDYQDAEAEVAFELLHTSTGKNAEMRKAETDIGLIRSRNEGALHRLWINLIVAQNKADSARLALDQMTKRYRAIESAAEITTAMLRALSR